MKVSQIFLGRWKMLVIVLMVSGVGVVAVGVAEEKATAAVASSSPEIKTQSFADIEFVWIEPGTFMMGSPDSEKRRSPDEGPQHQVTLTQGFWLGKYEVTQVQWESVMGSNPASNKGRDFPVEVVSWEDAQSFITKLNSLGKGTFRLPTEAEWEYACRAGSTSTYFFSDEPDQMNDYAWFNDNSNGTTHPVGQKHPNAWGLYDMCGNVWEWCDDRYGELSSEAVTDPIGPATGKYYVNDALLPMSHISMKRNGFEIRMARKGVELVRLQRSGIYRVIRGGAWCFGAGHSRSAHRHHIDDDCRGNYIGFRVVRNP